jgi:release factor glutamine methyltransferase
VTESRLAAAGIADAEVEARFLAEEASGLEGAELVVASREQPSDYAARHLESMTRRRAAGEPLQYVLGHWQFLDLDLLVDPRVLVPRPETEVVAQVAVEEVVRAGARRGRRDPWTGAVTTFAVADLGTGSGAIALYLASELPDAEVWATDVSRDALAVACANFAGAGSPAARVRAAEGSWFDALPEHLRGALRLVVSNPPYVAEDEVAGLPREVAEWEPMRALVSGATGLEALEHVVDHAPDWLDPEHGVLVAELAPHQAERMRVRASAAGFTDVSVRRDLTGRDRVLVARATG